MGNKAIIIILVIVIVAIIGYLIYNKIQQDKLKQQQSQNSSGLDTKSILSLFGAWGTVAGAAGEKAGVI